MRRSRRKKREATATGWFVAVLVERFEHFDEDKGNPDRKCYADENVVLLKAKTADEAYEKAKEHGMIGESIECVDPGTRRKGVHRFVGLAELLPVYEEIDDGCEIMWTEHKGKTVAEVEAMVLRKDELGAFRGEQGGAPGQVPGPPLQ